MKRFIWLLCGVFLSGLLLGALSACGYTQYGTITAVTTTPPSASREDPAPANGEEAGPIPAGDEDAPGEDEADPAGGGAVPGEQASGEGEARRMAYGKALWDAYLLAVLPDGTRLERESGQGPARGNQFALADVDGDGQEELVISWTAASMAGHMGLVYGYADGAVYEELSEFPALRFYDNGVAEADWSHNQGWAGRFWPYTLYQYSEETRDYARVGGVDAWDRSVTDQFLPSAFPHDIDADGDGLVYFLLSGEWAWGDHTAPDGAAYSTWAVDPVDGADYENWRNVYLDGAEEIEVPFQPLTEENIAALGYPRPDAEYPQPAD